MSIAAQTSASPLQRSSSVDEGRDLLAVEPGLADLLAEAASAFAEQSLPIQGWTCDPATGQATVPQPEGPVTADIRIIATYWEGMFRWTSVFPVDCAPEALVPKDIWAFVEGLGYQALKEPHLFCPEGQAINFAQIIAHLSDAEGVAVAPIGPMDMLLGFRNAESAKGQAK
ncbi:MAG: DUF6882 domain-containing protein [Pseudomonadota bacterium]